MKQDVVEQIRVKAYENYLGRNGSPQGSPVDDWVAAENEILGKIKPQKQSVKKVVSKLIGKKTKTKR